MERKTVTGEASAAGVPADPGAVACAVSSRFFADLTAFARLRAVKLYRLRVDVGAEVPRLPCLDHEAGLHEGVPPHAAAYVEEPDTGELHELVLIPSRRRIEVDPAATLHDHTEAGQARLLALLRTRFPDSAVVVRRLSRLRGDRRVARACRAQVSLREVLAGADFDRVARGLERLTTVAALMEKRSRVASWTVRTVTGPFLAAAGFFVYRGVDGLAPELGEPAVNTLQVAVPGIVGAVFLYYGLRAVHLTELANRVWKRAAEYGLIAAERQRLAAGGEAAAAGAAPAPRRRGGGPDADTLPPRAAGSGALPSRAADADALPAARR